MNQQTKFSMWLVNLLVIGGMFQSALGQGWMSTGRDPANGGTDWGNPLSSCTNNTIARACCDFDLGFCSWTHRAETHSGLKWVLSITNRNPISNDCSSSSSCLVPISVGSHGSPSNTINSHGSNVCSCLVYAMQTGSYIFLDVSDHNIANGSQATISAQLPAGITAVCIEFHYATSGHLNHSISLLNQVDNSTGVEQGDVVIGELKDVNTAGLWKTAMFSACVGNHSYITFASEKTSESSTVALDYVMIKQSIMSCPSKILPSTSTSVTSSPTVTNPVTTRLATKNPVTTDSTTTTTKPECSNFTLQQQSCDFDVGFCSWHSRLAASSHLHWVISGPGKNPVGHDWEPTNMIGSYIFLDVSDPKIANGSQATISAQLPAGITAVCIEFHFATSGHLNHSIWLLNQVDNGTGVGPGDVVIGELKDVNTGGLWQEAMFSACVGNHSYITFASEKTSESSTVALDYVMIKQSIMSCPSKILPSTSTSVTSSPTVTNPVTTRLVTRHPVTTDSTTTTTKPECSNFALQQQSCDFDVGFCSWHSRLAASSHLHWVISGPGKNPVGHDWEPTNKIGSYIFLDVSDPKIANGSQATISAQLPAGITAVCIEFHFATSGHLNHSIWLLNQVDNGTGVGPGDVVIGELKDVNTGGLWQEAMFSACVGNHSYITFASEKTSESSTVALDYVMIKQSIMSCPSKILPSTSTSVTSSPTVTNPVTTRLVTRHPVTTDSTTTTTKPECSNFALQQQSCDFDVGFCSWHSRLAASSHLHWVISGPGKNPVGHDWEPTNKIGSYIFLDVSDPKIANGSQATISAQLPAGITAVCIEFHFATSGHLNHSIWLLNQVDNGTCVGPGDVVIGELKDVNTGGLWQEAMFSACVGNNSYIVFEGTKMSESSTVALDYVRISAASVGCTTAVPSSTSTIPHHSLQMTTINTSASQAANVSPASTIFMSRSPYSTAASTLSTSSSSYSTSAGTISTPRSTYSIAAKTLSTPRSTYSTSAGTISTPRSTHSTSAGTISTSRSTYSTSAGTISTSRSTYSTSASTISTPRSTYSTSARTISTPRSTHSTSAGTISTSRSKYSTSAGTVSTSRSTYSTSAGTISTSRSTYSTSASTLSTSRSAYSASAGKISTPRSMYSTSAGTISTPRSTYSASAGTISTPRSTYSASAGTISTPRATHSTSAGTITTPRSRYSTSVGTISTPRSTYSASAGTISTPRATPSTSAGTITTPRSKYSTSVGTITTPRSRYSTSAGTISTPRSTFSISAGTISTPRSTYSTPASTITTPRSMYSTSAGTMSTPRSTYSTSAGTITTSSSTDATATVSIPTRRSTDAIATVSVPTRRSTDAITTVSVPTRRSTDAITTVSVPTQRSTDAVATVRVPTQRSTDAVATVRVPTQRSTDAVATVRVPTQRSTDAIATVSVPTQHSTKSASTTRRIDISERNPSVSTAATTATDLQPITSKDTNQSPNSNVVLDNKEAEIGLRGTTLIAVASSVPSVVVIVVVALILWIRKRKPRSKRDQHVVVARESHQMNYVGSDA